MLVLCRTCAYACSGSPHALLSMRSRHFGSDLDSNAFGLLATSMDLFSCTITVRLNARGIMEIMVSEPRGTFAVPARDDVDHVHEPVRAPFGLNYNEHGGGFVHLPGGDRRNFVRPFTPRGTVASAMRPLPTVFPSWPGDHSCMIDAASYGGDARVPLPRPAPSQRPASEIATWGRERLVQTGKRPRSD